MNEAADLHTRLLAATEPLMAGERYSVERLSGPVAALRAVVELHAPQDTYPSGGSTGRPLCFGCDLGLHADDHADWPCATIEAIAEHLGVKQ